MAPPRTVLRTSSCSLLLIYRPRKDERLSWLSWLTYSGRFTRINGHPSAVGLAQDSEISPVTNRRSIPLSHGTNDDDINIRYQQRFYFTHMAVSTLQWPELDPRYALVINTLLAKVVRERMRSTPTNWTVIFRLNNIILYGHIKTEDQRTIIQQYVDWYTNRWWMGCYIWYSPVPSSLYQT